MIYHCKSDHLKFGFPEGSVFDLSHMGGPFIPLYSTLRIVYDDNAVSFISWFWAWERASHMGRVKNWPPLGASKNGILLKISMFFLTGLILNFCFLHIQCAGFEIPKQWRARGGILYEKSTFISCFDHNFSKSPLLIPIVFFPVTARGTVHNGRRGGVRGGGCGVLWANEKESLAFGGSLFYSRGLG